MAAWTRSRIASLTPYASRITEHRHRFGGHLQTPLNALRRAAVRPHVGRRVRDLPQYHEDSDEVDAHLHGCEEALVTLVATALGCSWCDHVRRVGKRLPASYAVDRPALAAEVLRTLRDEREVQR